MRVRSIIGLSLVALLIVASGADARGHRRHRPHVGVSIGWGVGWGGGVYGPGWYGAGWWGPGWWGPGWYGSWPVGVVVGAPQLAVVDTDVKPEEARVYLDGTLIGTADDFDGYPDFLYLKPGRYTIEFRLPGYQSESDTIDAVAGARYRYRNRLVKAPGEVTPERFARPEGLPVTRVFGPEKPAVEEPAPAEAPARPDTSLRPELGRQPSAPAPAGAALELRVEPAKASVYVDGEFVGTGAELAALERGLAVAPGTHRIDVVAPGYVPSTVTVDVAQGERREVAVELAQGAGQSGTKELN